MFDEPAEPRLSRGAVLAALAGEDLSAYAVSDLEARVAALEAEVARARAAISAKRDGRSAADALFSLG